MEIYYFPAGFQMRSSLDRRFWHCMPMLHFAVCDDFGNLVASHLRPIYGC